MLGHLVVPTEELRVVLHMTRNRGARDSEAQACFTMCQSGRDPEEPGCQDLSTRNPFAAWLHLPAPRLLPLTLDTSANAVRRRKRCGTKIAIREVGLATHPRSNRWGCGV